jgi:hypothetical protein
MSTKSRESLVRALVDLSLTLLYAVGLMVWLSYAHKDVPSVPPLGFGLCYFAVFIAVGVVRLGVVGVKR